jgi:hypothetical protein
MQMEVGRDAIGGHNSTKTEVKQFNFISSKYFNYSANSCLWLSEDPQNHLFKFK